MVNNEVSRISGIDGETDFQSNIRAIQRKNELEAQLGLTDVASWHDQYKDSAYIYVGGLPFGLTEGDVICIFSQYGEPVDINMIRDKKTGKSRGFAFLGYEDQRSTVLAVDNLNGSQVLGKTLRVDHVSDYKRPDRSDDEDGGRIGNTAHEVYNAMPTIEPVEDEREKSEEVDLGADIPEDDPMRDYIISKRRKALRKEKSRHRYHKRSRDDDGERRHSDKDTERRHKSSRRERSRDDSDGRHTSHRHHSDSGSKRHPVDGDRERRREETPQRGARPRSRSLSRTPEYSGNADRDVTPEHRSARQDTPERRIAAARTKSPPR